MCALLYLGPRSLGVRVRVRGPGRVWQRQRRHLQSSRHPAAARLRQLQLRVLLRRGAPEQSLEHASVKK
eukprot:5267126-Prymnesium_polylepis.1